MPPEAFAFEAFLSAYTFITQLYLGYFNRAPDLAGLSYWEGVYASGALTLTDIARTFASSSEHKALLGNKPASADGLITQTYQNLFARAAEPDGLTYWKAQLDQQKADLAGVVATIAFAGAMAPGNDAAALTNRTIVAESYLEALQVSGQSFSLGSAAAAIGKVGQSAVSLEDGLAEVEAFAADANEPGVTTVYKLSANALVVQEGRGATIQVIRSGDVSGSAVVEITTSGNAANGADYTLSGLSGSRISFDANERVALIKLTALPDNLIEGDERVVISLRPLEGGGKAPVDLSITLQDGEQMRAGVAGWMQESAADPLLFS